MIKNEREEQLKKKYFSAWEKIKKAKNILLVSHLHPDGDAIGSVGAFFDLLLAQGKNVRAFCPSRPLFSFSFAPFFSKIEYEKNFSLNDFDLILVLDCGSLGRTGLGEEFLSARRESFVIEFDHHPKIDDYADLEIRETFFSSTSENIFYFFKTNKISFNKKRASSLLLGILSDTGNFLHNGVSAQTLKASSELLEYGVDFSKINKKIWQNKKISSLRFFGSVLSRLQINEKYNIAFTISKIDDRRKIDDEDNVLDWTAMYLANLADVRGVLFLREEDDGQGGVFLKGSFRSSDNKSDFSKLARLLGGGGHPKSAGFVFRGRIKEGEGGFFVEED